MKSGNESATLLNSYTGLDGRTLVTFVALVAGVLVVVTGIYVAIFGFQSWKRDMQQAGSMMVAGFNTRSPGVPTVPGQPSVAPGQVPMPGVANPRLPSAAQYVCPSCGAVGLPRWTATGTPICPQCGSVMAVAGRRGSNVQLAARP